MRILQSKAKSKKLWRRKFTVIQAFNALQKIEEELGISKTQTGRVRRLSQLSWVTIASEMRRKNTQAY